VQAVCVYVCISGIIVVVKRGGAYANCAYVYMTGIVVTTVCVHACMYSHSVCVYQYVYSYICMCVWMYACMLKCIQMYACIANHLCEFDHAYLRTY
jgi:hypothetical protein